MKDVPGPGHTLGGSGPGGGGGAGTGGSLSPEEMRARRLAALSGRGGGGGGGGGVSAQSSQPLAAAAAASGGEQQGSSGGGAEGRLKDPPPRHVSFGGASYPLPAGASLSSLPALSGAGGAPLIAGSAAATGGGMAMDIDNDQDDDVELQRALALSLMGTEGEGNVDVSGTLEAAASALGGGGHGGHGSMGSVADRPPTPSPADGNDKKPAAVGTGDVSMKPPAAVAAKSDDGGTSSTQKAPEMENVVLQIRKNNGGNGGVPKSHLKVFHSIMWNDTVTTEGDRERWRGQGIDTTPSLWDSSNNEGAEAEAEAEAEAGAMAAVAESNSSSTASLSVSTAASSVASAAAVVGGSAFETVAAAATSNAAAASGFSNDVGSSSGETSPIASALGSNHATWGLTQVHGGPCGVLAAVQAEMLRMILFGRCSCLRDQQQPPSPSATRTSTKDDGCSGDVLRFVHYPRTATRDMAATPPTEVEVKEALALAIGTILARAALVPLASAKGREAEEESKKEGWVKVAGKKKGEEDDAEGGRDVFGVRIVLPADAIDDGAATNESSMVIDDTPNSASVGAYDGLTWGMLDASSEGEGLCVCTINLSPEDAEDEGAGPESKRQRKNSGDGSTVVQCEACLEGRLACLATATARFLLEKSRSEQKHSLLRYFSGQGGVLLLVLSLLESRGVERTKNDMDDTTSTLTSQFGHSSQELINLLLTGQAVSNVFDNSMELGGDVVCRGVQSQPAVGYLTQLEAMRYCEVGGHYKTPLFPIWVVGSTSHFTVLFGDTRCMQESSSDVLLEKCRRAFRAVDGNEDNGFIQVSSLCEVLKKLNLYDKVGADGLQTLKASLEVHGAGIILWSDFWKVSSRLLTGASLESVLQGDKPGASKDQPLMLTQFGEGAASSSTGASAAAASSVAAGGTSAGADSTMLSDEELARKLAAEWGTDPGPAAPVAAAPSSSSAQKSDEELARELQAQWNADSDMPPLEVTNIVGNDIIAEAKTEVDQKPPSNNAMGMPGTVIPEAGEAKKTSLATSAEDGNTFDLYHYNGLRGGTLTSFRVIRPKSTDAVGSSITLSSHGGNASRDGGDLEDVVRTKWQQCRFDWLGKRPPYID